MKIPLDFTPQKDKVSVICTVRLPPKNLPVPIKFLVDTGSPETFIDEIDVMRFRIYAKNFPFTNPLLMAGTKVNLYRIGEVTMNFRNEKDNLETLKFTDLKVAESAWTRPGAVSVGTSILGMNFLRETKLHLFVDPAHSVGYLGRKED